MRIELPLPSWADAQRAQDDAHTLTLPAHPLALPVALPASLAEDDGTARIEVPAGSLPPLTLTF